MNDTYCVGLSALDDFDMAVARFDRAGVLTYQNPAAARLFGVRMDEHVDVSMLIPDPEELQRVLSEIRSRAEGKSSVYRTAFRPPHLPPAQPDIPISVYAFPDLAENGHILGSIILVRDLREETAREKIHEVIETSAGDEELFSRLAAHLRPLLEFEELRVVTISKSGQHLRQVYSSNRAAQPYTFRWWPMPPFIRETLHERTAEVIEVTAMLADPNYQELLQRDAATRDFFQSGVRQVLSLPIYDENRIVAFFSLDSHAPGRYAGESVRLLERLPVSQAVLSALHREQRERQGMVLELIRDIGALSTDVHGAAEVLVSRLVEDFGWDHVAIYQHEPTSNEHRLVFQANLPGTPLLPERHVVTAPAEGAADAGPPGAIVEATATNRIVNVAGTRMRGPFSGQPGFDGTGSELAIPISGRKVRWVLNIESSFTNAFAAEEIELLEVLASEACLALHRSALFELQKALLASINDAVIETAIDGRIRWSNRAAKDLLGVEAEPAQPTWIAELLDPSVRQSLADAEQFYHREANMLALSGERVPVLLSCTTLPDHLSGRVYVASDFRFQKEVQRLSELKEVFRLAAMEGRIPLALASVWLRELGQALPEQQDCIDKVTAELGRADLPLERLFRLFSSETTPVAAPRADLNQAVQVTLAELPRTMVDTIALAAPPAPAPVAVTFDTLQFCVESMISFGLRTRPQSRMLQVQSTCSDKAAVFRVSGDWQPDMTSSRQAGPSEQWRRKSLTDLTLGESVISRIIEKAGGQCRFDLEQDLNLEFRLPLLAD
jgi:PAS domain-containing protein